MKAIRNRPDCSIGGKRIQSIADSIYTYSAVVTVESTPQPFAEPSIEVEDETYIDPFSAEIKKYYNFDLDVEVKKAKLGSAKAIADKHNKCLIIDDDFNLEEDFAEFLLQYIDLTVQGNVVTALSKFAVNLLKK